MKGIFQFSKYFKSKLLQDGTRLVVGSHVRLSVVLAVFLLLVGIFYGGYFYWGPGPHRAVKQVILPAGASLSQIAEIFDDAGVLRSTIFFQLMARGRGVGHRLQAGEYAFPARASVKQVLDMVSRGQILLHAVTIAEGLTSQRVIEQLRDNELLIGEVALPPEGRLLPETYRVPRGMARSDLVQRMMAAQVETLAELWPRRAAGLPFQTPREAVILASIVERETGLAVERPMVAAVFINRLRRNMRLQSDPTIIYGLVGGVGELGRPIRRSEIRRRTAYNTYRIRGLPPTPIANPGRASLVAVLNPATTDALYFVADGTGGHVFATTLAQHNRNVRRWRQIQKQMKNDK